MNSLVAKVTGINEAAEHTVEGFIAIGPDGRVFNGNGQTGAYVVRSSNYLARIAFPGSAIVPVKLTIQADPSIDPAVLARAIEGMR